jgi:hypothetical protein
LIVLGITVVFVAIGAPIVLSHWSPELHVLVVAIVLVIGLVAVTGRAVRHIKHLRPESSSVRALVWQPSNER